MAEMSCMYVLLIVSCYMRYHLKDMVYYIVPMLILFFNPMQHYTQHGLRLLGIYNTERKAGKL